jgi:hypothetical protein
MPQLNGPAVNSDTNAQRTTVIAPFPIRLVLMAIGAEALKVIWVALEVTVAMRAPDVIDLRCSLDDAAQFAVLAKWPSAQGSRAGDLAPVARTVEGAIGFEGRAIIGSHVDLLQRVVPAGGASRSPPPCAKMAALNRRPSSRFPNDHRRPGGARQSWVAGRTPTGPPIYFPPHVEFLFLIQSLFLIIIITIDK